MSTDYITLPDGFSLDFPSYDLVLNVSPFPVFKCRALVEKPYEAPNDFLWIKINPNLFGLYEKKIFINMTCPTCGRPFNGSGDKE